MAIKNSVLLEKVWLEAGNEFQQRIPNPTISGMAATMDALFQPYNASMYNQFSELLNGVANTYIERKVFDNPLRNLKKPAALFGNTERHVAAKYMQAHSYKYDDETLLKLEKPEYREWFYSRNYNTRYEFSWSRTEMARAFAEDGYGFNDLLAATLDAQRSSDQVDEMNTMIQLFAEADNRIDGGLFRETLSAAPTTKAAAQELLVKIRAIAGKMKFPSTYYNHIDVPVFETPETLVLWVTPETDAYIDVMALAELFNVERAEVQFKKIIIPEFPIANVYAALTSEDFIFWRDMEFGIYDFWNPSTLTTKFYLQHIAMCGINPAANCVLFTTDAATNIPTYTQNITGMNIVSSGAIAIGGKTKIGVELVGTITDENNNVVSDTRLTVQPNAATYEIVSAVAQDDTPIQLNSATRFYDDGTLQLQKTGIEAGATITIRATSAYINPSGTTTEYTSTANLTVEPYDAPKNKECEVEEKPYIVYDDSTEETPATI